MSEEFIKVRGARSNNLKSIDVDIPKNKMTVITGLSGSGKSSLAFDTIYAEGQRRYVESLSAYARQFLGLMDKPDVDLIEGLQPAISIDQKSTGHNPRSTVGTVTEIYDYLRLLFARVGHPRSPVNGHRLEKQTVQQIVDKLFEMPPGKSIIILSPIIKNRKGTYEELFTRLLGQGYARVRVDDHIYSLEEDIKLDKFVKHNIELVVDRVILDSDSKELQKRVTDSVELALNMGDGEIYVNISDEKQNEDLFFSEKLVDKTTGQSFPEVEPHSFSFNSPHGACPNCNGLGAIKEIDESLILNPRLTVMEGGIYPWARMIETDSSYMMGLLKAMSEVHKIDLRKQLGKLPADQLSKLLYGTGSEKYSVNHTNSEGRTNVWNSKFEGVIPNLQRRYLETDSEYIRSEIEQYMIDKMCPVCLGNRLKKEALAVTIAGVNIVDVGNMSIKEAFDWMESLSTTGDASFVGAKSTLSVLFDLTKADFSADNLTNQEMEIGKQVFKEILARLNFLKSVGLEYLTLNRTARTLSGGEAQRIRLASQIGTGLTGVLYVLDEPSIGLHQRDNDKLIHTLEHLRDIGNTVVVVEHDEDTIRKADYIVDIGPGAGEHGGKVIFQGSSKLLSNNDLPQDSLTFKYLTGKQKISKENILKDVNKIESVVNGSNANGSKKGSILLTNVTHNNLKGFDFEVPLGKFVCVTGVSGSGKSSLVNDVFYRAIAKQLYGSKEAPGQFSKLIGIENIDKVIDIDQSPIGRTPRSNPATYTGTFNIVRELFAQTKEARARGYKAGRFSFNVKGGRCEKCQGAGVIQISMQFLPDVYVKCDVCDGHRYNRETLQIDYKGKNIAEVLNMTVEESLAFFANINQIKSKIQTLVDVGLGYIRLGQAATTLSGGESQRVKLAAELSKRSTGKTLYILDEPTTGLHFEDVRKLLIVLHGLVQKGNSVLVIEHNLDVIKTADWIIDLGPEGGDAGGTIVALGTPEEIANTPESYTGQWLKKEKRSK